MYALIGILKKPADMDTATFRQWWLEEHAMGARLLPKLRKYVVYPLVRGFDPATGQTDGDRRAATVWHSCGSIRKKICARRLHRRRAEATSSTVCSAPIEYQLFCTDAEIVIPLPGHI